jgi:hypothetical protein
MPPCAVLRYQDANGVVPFDEWLTTLARPGKTQNPIAAHKLAAAVTRLATEGHALRRPTADRLREGIYELRVRVGRVNFRALFFFAGSGVAVLVHGCTKHGEVDAGDIDRAIMRRVAYMSNPRAHTAPAP